MECIYNITFAEPTKVVLYYWDQTQTETNKTIAPQTIRKTNGTVYIKCEIKLDSQNYLLTSNNERMIDVCAFKSSAIMKLHTIRAQQKNF